MWHGGLPRSRCSLAMAKEDGLERGKKREMQTLIICYNFMLQLCYICAEMWNICRFLLIFLKK